MSRLDTIDFNELIEKATKERCEEILERHDFEEKEGANRWMKSNEPC